MSRLCGADYEIVNVAAHLEPAGLVDPAGLHRLEGGGSNQPVRRTTSPVRGSPAATPSTGTSPAYERSLEDLRRDLDEHGWSVLCGDIAPRVGWGAVSFVG